MRTILFKDWKILADDIATRKAYSEIERGNADSCICTMCKNYGFNRNSHFPAEALSLLEQIGVDYRKDAEVSYYGKLSSGLHYYGGCFHYKGFFEGNSALNGVSLSLTPLTENFSLGFHVSNDRTLFQDKESLIQIDFSWHIPWLIHEPEEK